MIINIGAYKTETLDITLVKTAAALNNVRVLD